VLRNKLRAMEDSEHHVLVWQRSRRYHVSRRTKDDGLAQFADQLPQLLDVIVG
jgi:hypothetical protein